MINEKNYYEDREYITNSMLGYLKRSPMHFYHYLQGNYKLDSDILSFGSAYHEAVLEPEKFIDKYAVVPKGMKRGDYKPFNEFKEKNPGKEYISESDYDKIFFMREGLLANKDAMQLIDGGYKEKIRTWTIGDIKCKCKIDKYNEDIIVDLKTSSDCSIDAFRYKAINSYDYDRQAAYYLDSFNDNKERSFWFVVQEKEPPYISAIYEAGTEFVNRGREKYLNLISTFNALFIENDFVPDQRQLIGIL